MNRVTRMLILLPIALTNNSAGALEVSQAQYMHAGHMDALFKSAMPSEARILEISTGNNYEIQALLPAPAEQTTDKKIGMTYSANFDATSVSAKPAEYLVQIPQCREPTLTPAKFSFITALNVKRQAAGIAVELNLPGIANRSSRLLTDEKCQSYWQQSINKSDDSGLLALLKFDISGKLQAFQGLEKNQFAELSKAEVDALNAATQISAERTQPKPASLLEAQDSPAFPVQGEYLQMQLDGVTWFCLGDDMELNYDYFQLEFECSADDENQLFGFTLSIPVEGELRSVDSADGGLRIWWRQGDLLYADRHEDDRYSLRLTRFTAKEISGEFSADLHLQKLPEVRIRSGRFRILPSAGFRVTPP